MLDLSVIRERIDQIDTKISSLFLERMEVTADVAEFKRATGKPVFDRARERDNIKRAADRLPENLASYGAALESLLMDASRSAQYARLGLKSELAQCVTTALEEQPSRFPKEARVACLGIGDTQHAACDRLLRYASVSSFNSPEEVIDALEKGDCAFGVIPIESSDAGSLNAMYDLIVRHGFYIVRSCLIKLDRAPFADDEEEMLVISGPSLQSHEGAYTRYACITKELTIYPNSDRTSFVVTLPNVPGSLYQLLGTISALGLNLVKLESRPVPNNNSVVLCYLDIACPVSAPEFQTLLNVLGDTYEELRYLGSYAEVV
ncbi:MAG: chorismate mutase [Atopobiaceae bacterium]|nr:chorismate mutase [Atopobiaceae bacterium]